MIVWLVISHGGGDRGDLHLDCGFLGDRAKLLQCLKHAYLGALGDPVKMVA